MLCRQFYKPLLVKQKETAFLALLAHHGKLPALVELFTVDAAYEEVSDLLGVSPTQHCGL